MQTHLVDILLDHHIPIEDWGKRPLDRLRELESAIESNKAMLAFTERGRLVLRSHRLTLVVRRCGQSYLVPMSVTTADRLERAIPDLGYTFSQSVRPDCDLNESLLSMLRLIGISPGVSEFELYCILEEERETMLSIRYPGVLESVSGTVFVWEMLDPYFKHRYVERHPDRSIVYGWFGPVA